MLCNNVKTYTYHQTLSSALSENKFVKLVIKFITRISNNVTNYGV